MKPNAVVLAHRLRLAKDIRADANDPLAILFYNGGLRRNGEKTDSDAQYRYEAGLELRSIYWRLFGKPFARAPGGVHGIDAIDGAKSLHDESVYRDMVRALDRLGNNARRTVIDCCVHMHTPHVDRVTQIAAALERLSQMDRTKLSDGQREHARAEMVA